MSKRHKPHDEEHIDETWLIPYADLLTLLLALFIVLFASSEMDSRKFDQMTRSFSAAFMGGTGFMDHSLMIPTHDDSDNRNRQTEEEPEGNEGRRLQYQKETLELDALRKALDAYIQENGLATQLETNLNHSQLMITIRDNALFASGSANLHPEARALAVAIANMLGQYPGYEIKVAGHTDPDPINTREFQSNWDLSSKRAVNFMKILLQNDKLDPRRFSAVGYGEHHPIAPNTTAEGKAQNRRVEVSIIRNIMDES